MKKQEAEQFVVLLNESFKDTSLLNLTKFNEKSKKWIEKRGESIDDLKFYDKLSKTALDYVDIDNGKINYVAARILLNKLYTQAAKNRGYDKKDKYGDFYSLVKMLSSLKSGNKYTVYNQQVINKYTKEEIEEAGKWIDPEKDHLFSYIGLFMLQDRYLATPTRGEIYELPQERFLIISLVLMQNETENRLEKVKEAYWALSNLYMTVATPTLSNAGKDSGQLSSCFIDMMEDSIDGIYNTNHDTARVSKWGGGVGIYAGKVRSVNSAIRGYENTSSGTTPWIRLLNQTAVSVDQLGQRQGAIAVYLDVWHKDIFNFLNLKTNNGDERLKAHDVFTGVCVPDLFMEAVRDRKEWYLFEGLYTEEYLGFRLEDHYDEKKGDGTFRRLYAKAVKAAENGILPPNAFEKVDAIDIMKAIMKSLLETGVPYMFFRDEANRKNPNKHKGMIYCSNLCSEISQNMRPTVVKKEIVTEYGTIITEKIPGDYVVCNLSSINLGKAVPANVLERLIPIQVRMLDNVIDINNLPLKQASITNSKYRPVGLGTFGWHHLLAQEHIYWESEESVEYADKLYEKIAYLTIKASMDLSKEKGAYPYFEGSDWATGDYFDLRNYTSSEWLELKADVSEYGIRNGYVMAVAPNSSTAKIGDSSDGIDPVYGTDYFEEKKNFKFRVTAPDLDHTTYPYYVKNRYNLDQRWSIKQNAKRQRHIDQSISFNLYVYNTVKAKELLDLYIMAWESGLKSVYYLKSSTYDASHECEACQS